MHVQTGLEHSATADGHLPPARGATARGLPATAVRSSGCGSGDDPGCVEHPTKGDGGGAADGCAVAEGRRKHGERAGARRERALDERLAHRLDEPGRKRPEAPAQDDRVEVEQVERRGERDAERATGIAQRGEDGRVAVLRTADELVGDALRPTSADRDTRRPGDRLLADERLDTAAAPACAGVAGGVDRDVAELAAEAVAAAEEPAAEYDAASDPDLAEDADEVVDPDRRAGPVLGQRGEIRLVLDVDGKPQTMLELRRDGNAVPAEVRREDDRPGRLLDEPRDGDRDPDRDAAPREPRPRARLARPLPSRSSTGPGTEPRLSP